MKKWKKIFHASGNQKRAGAPILVSVKIDFTSKVVIRNKDGHYTMIRGQEYITTINIYEPNIRASEYIKQIVTDLMGEIDNSTIIQVYK